MMVSENKASNINFQKANSKKSYCNDQKGLGIL